MMHGFGWTGFGFLGWLGMIFNLLLGLGLLVGLVLLVIWGVRRLGMKPGVGGENANSRAEALTPRDIVMRRYASGEITREQFQELMADLS
jgi:uncharacterized membrane protein